MSAHTGTVDFQGIASLALSQSRSLIPQWLPNGKLHGVEYRCGGLDGSPGESFAVNLNKGAWSDFATGAAGGDLVSLYAALHRTSQIEAARELSDSLLGRGAVCAPSLPKLAAQSDWAAIIPVPADAPPPPDAHYKHGKPAHIARYLTRDGELVGYIYRCDTETGKEVYPLTFCQNAKGRNEWRWLSFPKPRALYGAELLADGGRILLVEGEPKADAARRMLGDAMTVIAWPGGAKAVQHADWSMLAGRDVVIWPDADAAGIAAAAAITIQLRHHGATVRTVDPPAGVAKGWDLADAEREGWSGEEIMRHIFPQEPDSATEWEDTSAAVEPVAFDFVPLGHDKGKFYLFTSRGGQVREFTSRDLHSVSCLCELARLRYWEMNYPGKGEAGFNVRSAGDAIISLCFQVGIYDPSRVRGLGAWIDEGRTVLHIGDRCILDGTEASIVIPKSRYIYENSIHMEVDLGEPLSSAEANLLRELCCAAPWERPDHMGQMLAGWLVIAPVCGAMVWRPHLWITSEGGGGKSWILDNILKPIVGPIALAVQSKTTEAAIRQTLGCDARPIIFDEAESQNERDRDRIQHVLDIARQASSEDGAPIIKGGANGKASSFRIRSCFAFSSINVGMSQAADESRTVVLTLNPDRDSAARNAAFVKLKALHAKTMTPGFSGRLLARTLSLLPIIRQNSIIFAEAIARSGKTRRLGDTYGVLMAGAWSLRSRSVVTSAEADKVVGETQWVKDAVAKSDVEPEWQRALATLLQYRTRVVNANGRSEDIPVGDLIATCKRVISEGAIHPIDAALALSRMGIKAGDNTLLIANRAAICGEVFERTAWAACWHATISRAPGAKKDAANIRLGGNQTKCLGVPMDLVISSGDS